MSHEHKATMVREETWRKAPVAGTSIKRFVYPYCGGPDGCGAVWMDDLWFTNPEREALYENARTRAAS